MRAWQERHDDRQDLPVQNMNLDLLIEERVVDADPIGQESIGLRLVDEGFDHAKDQLPLRERDDLVAGNLDLLPSLIEIIRRQARMQSWILENRLDDRLQRESHQIGNRALDVCLCKFGLIPKHRIVPEIMNHGAPLMRRAVERTRNDHAVVVLVVRAILIQNRLLHAACLVRAKFAATIINDLNCSGYPALECRRRLQLFKILL